MLFLTIFPALSLAQLSPPSRPVTLPALILRQFPDYDLIIHVNSSTGHHLDFLAQTKLIQRSVYLINYRHKTTEKKLRPERYKLINIVLLEDPFIFQEYSSEPYNFYAHDFVLFVTTQIQGAQIWKMIGLKRAAGVLIYEMLSKRIFHCCHYCGNATGVLKQTKMVGLRGLLNDYSNFNGHVFRIAYTHFPPFFWKGVGEERSRGAEGRLLNQLSKVHNFRYELVEYQSTPDKGAWKAMIQAVEADAIDWAVGGISATLKRGTFTDFTRYIKTQGFAIAYAVYSDTWVNFESVLLVFNCFTWILVFLTIVLISYLAKVATTALGRHGTWARFAAICVLAIAEQAASIKQMKHINLVTVRGVFLVWWLTSLSLTTIYKSQLASLLIKPYYNQPNQVEELVEKDFRFHVKKVDWSVLKENLETSLDKVYSKILTRIEDNLDFCDSIQALDDRKVAVIDEEITLQYGIFKRCLNLTSSFRSKLRLVTENIFPSTYHAWSMPMGTPFRLKFSKTIARMEGYGLIHFWYKSAYIYHLPRSNSRVQGTNTSALTLTQMLPPFMILSIGLSLALVVLLVEKYVVKQ